MLILDWVSLCTSVVFLVILSSRGAEDNVLTWPIGVDSNCHGYETYYILDFSDSFIRI